MQKLHLAAALPPSIAALALATGYAQSPGEPPPAPPRELALPSDLWTEEVVSPFGVVVSSSAAAADAGVALLESGGNAVDAAVAAAFALAASEPGASGLGGQTLMLIHLANGRTVAIDGAGAVPRRTRPDELRSLAEREDSHTLKSAAVPGTVAALALALDRYGTTSLAEVLAPAIEIAELGFTMTPTEHGFLTSYRRHLRRSEYLCELLLDDCFEPFGPQHRTCLPDLACTLRWLASHGADNFYRGAIAAAIEADMIEHGGYVRRDDLAQLRAIERQPLRGSYRGYELLSFPPPGGGAAVVQALHVLETFPAEQLRSGSVNALQILAEAVRLALADTHPASRNALPPELTVGDKEHAARRAALIRPDQVLTEQEVGRTSMLPMPDASTTQLTVADAYGNVVSLTQTLGRHYGGFVASARLGFPYNNLLENLDHTDTLSAVYLVPGRPPPSTMAPTIVLRDGKPFVALGSVGSGRITSAIVAVLVNLIDGGMPLCEAVSAPRILWEGMPLLRVLLEIAEPITTEKADALHARGFTNMFRLDFPANDNLGAFGATNPVMVHEDGTVVGVGDPRRHCVARGATRIAGVRHSPVAALPCWRDLAASPPAAHR